MIRELREELERVKNELQSSIKGRRQSTSWDMLVMRGQIKENEAIIKELETPWEEKVRQSEVRNAHVLKEENNEGASAD